MLRCGSDRFILERTCRALRYAIKGAAKACAALLPALLDVIPRRFRDTRHSALLYIFRWGLVQGGQKGEDEVQRWGGKLRGSFRDTCHSALLCVFRCCLRVKKGSHQFVPFAHELPAACQTHPVRLSYSRSGRRALQ